MIVVELEGGLGNQMFQYAFGRSLAVRRGVALGLDTRQYTAANPRRYALGRLKIEAQRVGPLQFTIRGETHADGPSVARRARDHLQRKVLRSVLRVPELTCVREQARRFDPSAYDAPDGTYLRGYWQNERYFADIAPLLRAELVPSGALSPRSASLLARITGAARAVSVHIRRGDYVTDTNAQRFHGVCSVDYYERAMAHIVAASTTPTTFFLFSDDMTWTRATFGGMSNVVFAEPLPEDLAYEDIHLMTHCRHHIVANSSFSWWGAWLNRAPDKVIIAPEKWLVADPIEIVPASWVRL